MVGMKPECMTDLTVLILGLGRGEGFWELAGVVDKGSYHGNSEYNACFIGMLTQVLERSYGTVVICFGSIYSTERFL